MGSIREFTIIRRLGEGGMGEVYLARDRNLGRNVAAKGLSPELTRNAQFIERFQHEARTPASLSFKNLRNSPHG